MSIQQIVSGREGPVVRIAREDSVRTAVARLAERQIGALPVMEGDRPIGVFSERDLLRCLHEQGAAALDHPVGEAMTAPAVTVKVEMSALVALSLMTRRRIRHLPVVNEDGTLRDFISIGDLVKHRMDRIESEAEALREYISS